MIGSAHGETILRLLEATLDRPVTADDDTPLIEGGIVDSLSILGLVSRIEDEFGFEFDDDDLTAENFATLARITAMVEHKLAE